jgi:hypothetical protein
LAGSVKLAATATLVSAARAEAPSISDRAPAKATARRGRRFSMVILEAVGMARAMSFGYVVNLHNGVFNAVQVLFAMSSRPRSPAVRPAMEVFST